MHFHQARAKESLEAAGAYETVVAPFIRETGWHLLGTCKMGDDPATSVVDGLGPMRTTSRTCSSSTAAPGRRPRA